MRPELISVQVFTTQWVVFTAQWSIHRHKTHKCFEQARLFEYSCSSPLGGLTNPRGSKVLKIFGRPGCLPGLSFYTYTARKVCFNIAKGYAPCHNIWFRFVVVWFMSLNGMPLHEAHNCAGRSQSISKRFTSPPCVLCAMKIMTSQLTYYMAWGSRREDMVTC